MGSLQPMMEHGRDGCWSTKISGSHKTVLIVCSGWRTPWWISQNFPRHFHPTVFIFFFLFGVRLVCNWGLLHTCLATSLFSFIQTFPWTKSFYINPVLASASWRTRTNISLLDSLRFGFWKSVSPYQSMVVEPEQWEDGALWVLVALVVAGVAGCFKRKKTWFFFYCWFISDKELDSKEWNKIIQWTQLWGCLHTRIGVSQEKYTRIFRKK